ncbi:cytochrome P450 [Dactylosporangium maewongense]|uniref:Cytochrome P450 n=1 Tax=Dactylosporangium maewongense TaxID=634393 RepID=A0ABN2BLD4_9ACTN
MSGSSDRLGPLPAFLGTDARQPVAWVRMPTGDEMWVVSDYTLARIVLTDPRFSRAAAARPEAPKFNTANPSRNSIMSMDGSEHTRLRRLVNGAFTPSRTAAMTRYVEELTDRLLTEVAETGPPADLIASFATPLPIAVLTRLLGVPLEDGEQFRTRVEMLFDITFSTPREKAQHGMALVAYMTGLIERKRRHPGDDLISALIAAQDGGALSSEALLHLGLALLMAGYETTVGQLGLAALWYLTEPSLRARLDGGEVSGAIVEELIRLTPAASVSFPRVALEDVRLGDVTVRAGQAALVDVVHANRDGQVFPDPGRLEADGRATAHLTFGIGPHYCVGAPLARMQVRTALSRMIARFPGLALAPGPDAVRWKDGLTTRGLTHLHVTW